MPVPNCPVPSPASEDRITLAHGEGGWLMRKLIDECILPILGPQKTRAPGDSAELTLSSQRIAFTTDSFVVSPLFFPGGDIGTLAVFGTANDLVVSGARPRWISLSLIIEEGLPLSVLTQVLESVAKSARSIDVEIATGDTKVVPRGAADGLFINTSGIGELVEPVPPGPQSLEVGDALILTGPAGCHGVSILAAREGIEFQPPPSSDCRPLLAAADALREAEVPVKAMRDATRGGVTAVLHEWAAASGRTLSIEEQLVPLSPEVMGVTELLGLEPLHLANEGAMLVAVPRGHADSAVQCLHGIATFDQAARIGAVAEPQGATRVTIRRLLGNVQPLDEPTDVLLPRIC